MKKYLSILFASIFELYLLSTITYASDFSNQILLKKDASNGILELLTNPIFLTLLLTVATLLIIFELFFNLKGLGIIFSILSLIVFFFGNVSAGYADVTEILLFLIGAILLIFEIFIPGFGIPGILGTGMVIFALYNSMENTALSLIPITVAGIVGLLAFVIIFKMGFRSNAFNKIVLNEEISSHSNPNKGELLGKSGITTTMLRPSGKVHIDGQTYDAITEGDFIQSNKPVKVYKVEGYKIIVKEENI